VQVHSEKHLHPVVADVDPPADQHRVVRRLVHVHVLDDRIGVRHRRCRRLQIGPAVVRDAREQPIAQRRSSCGEPAGEEGQHDEDAG
jgi:hypothetical protein